MKFDKSTWAKVKLIDVVTKKEENDRENAHKRFDRFLKVEHLDAESIHIKQWASQKQGDEINPTFYKIFRKGQILFPTRNPHLRRTALASFDGICGEKTLTLEPNSGVIIPEFIPFLFHSESFYAHTTSSIIGSTNPHCRWRDVANYEFLLPPKALQVELSKLLWAMDNVLQYESEALSKLNIYSDSICKTMLEHKPNWTPYKIRDLMEFNYGKALKENLRIDGDYVVVSSAGIQGAHNKSLVSGPGIVVGRKGNVGDVTWVEKDFWPIDTAYFISIKEEFIHLPFKFFYYLLKSLNLKKYSIATAVPGLNRDDALLTNVLLPSEKEIDMFVNKFEMIHSQAYELKKRLDSSYALQKALINQVF